MSSLASSAVLAVLHENPSKHDHPELNVNPLAPPSYLDENPDPNVIQLTQESAGIMMEHVIARFRNIFTVMEDNMGDDHHLNINIKPNYEYAAMQVRMSNCYYLVMTWTEWEQCLEELTESIFFPSEQFV